MPKEVRKIMYTTEYGAEREVDRINGIGNGEVARIAGRGGFEGAVVEVPILHGRPGIHGETTREKFILPGEACVVIESRGDD